MIEIIEKEGYYDDSPFTGQRYMHPVYMVKNGKEFFMFNRPEPEEKYSEVERIFRTKQLTDNDGAYMRFNGYYADPEEMLREIKERRHTFTEDKLEAIIVRCTGRTEPFWDFHGNRREVSAAFFYRIYDETLKDRITEKVKEILKGRGKNDAAK